MPKLLVIFASDLSRLDESKILIPINAQCILLYYNSTETNTRRCTTIAATTISTTNDCFHSNTCTRTNGNSTGSHSELNNLIFILRLHIINILQQISDNIKIKFFRSYYQSLGLQLVHFSGTSTPLATP